jgi:hypothetical protein
MNDSIKELAKSAGLNFDGWGYPVWGSLGGTDEKKEFLEKFAELIVRECADVTQDFVDHRFPASEYPIRLKRYFGVVR